MRDGCLREQFGIEPHSDLWGYEIHPTDEDHELARRYLERDLRVTASGDGRYPVVLIHYEGNTSAGEKNLPVSLVAAVCEQIIKCGAIPVILDWDHRSPLPDGKRIFNPHPDLELWRGFGTGDAGVLAALIERTALLIGVDSGPLHVAAATTTPSLAVWTGHHPLHYLCPSDNVVHLVPDEHERLLRGDREAGKRFFEKHYRFETYGDLEPCLTRLVEERLRDADGALVFTRSFWIRTNNADQDLVVVNDIFENDGYHVTDLPMPAPVVVDIGAHIGCFAAKIHQRNPLARIICLECCPENIPALRKNVGGFATVIQAAVTYEKDVGLLNAVFPGCVTTGGSIVASRAELARRLAAGELPDNGNGSAREYWADLRPLRSMTLEEIVQQQRIEQIDLLKLDCEGSEFSILENTALLDRIGMVVGEYHGREAFLKLVNERFVDWELQILKDGELGTFWLTRKSMLATRPPAVIPGHVGRPDHESARPVALRMIISALRSEPRAASDLLLMDNGTVISRLELGETQIRGFARLDGMTWAVDSRGGLHHVSARGNELRLAEISRSTLAREAHDLAVIGRTLITASPANNLIACFDTQSGSWSAQRPWLTRSTAENTESAVAEFTDLYHLNCAVPDGQKFLLSLFAQDAKPASARWRDMDLDGGVIARWGRDGFDEGLVVEGIYGPHSIRLHDGYVWWCDAFRGQVARSDGWRSEPLGGFARGLRLVDGRCLVGLSMSRVGNHPHLEFCGIAVVDATTGAQLDRLALPAPYTEVYSVWPLASPDD